jgi:hypothetical protein
MQHYNLEDFIRYYNNSFILHPKTGEVVSVKGRTTDRRGVMLSNGTSVTLEELDWLHVQTPRLGYRHTNGGALLFHANRHAGRHTEKGITLAAVVVEVPGVVKSLLKLIGAKDKTAALDHLTAALLHSPRFCRLVDAIKALKEDKNAVGFALSHDWAVTLGLHKGQEFLLHFKGLRVARSSDGHSWIFNDTTTERLFNRSSL